MNIHGLVKLTLLDYPEHIACTIFTGGCNYRCPFCHNASLVTHVDDSTRISEEEIFSFLQSRIGILDGVVISGGEPTLQPDLISFIQKVVDLGYKIKLDTNGTNPDLLANLLDLHLLNYVAMDIKNSRENYMPTIGLPAYDISQIDRSIDLLNSSGIDYELRTTVVRQFHSSDILLEIAHWIPSNSKYYLQAFVDSRNLIQSGFTGYNKAEMNRFADILRPLLPNVAVRGIE